MKKNRKLIIGFFAVFIFIASAALYFFWDAVNKNADNINKDSLQTTGEQKNNSDIELNDDRTSYYIYVKLDTDKKTLFGQQTVKFKNTYESPLKELVFHLYPDSYNSAATKPSIGITPKPLSNAEIGDIEISSLLVNKEGTKFAQENQVLKIPLSKELKPNETAEVTLDFTLKIPNDRDRLGYYKDQYSVTNWYPILSVYDAKASIWDENPFYPVGESNYSNCSDYDVEIDVPKNMVVATTGTEVSKQMGKERDKIRFKAENVRDFDFFASKDYKVITQNIDGVKVNSYFLNYDSSAKRMLDLACKSLKFFNSNYGKYPYSEYDVVETYLEGGAMEYPTITQMGLYPKLNEKYGERELTFYDEAVVHETGHQWFYSTVGNNEFKEPVLDESFTSYATALFFEKLYGQYNPLAVKGAFLTVPLKSMEPISRSSDKYTWNDFERVVYRMGPAVLEDLRRKVGEDKFTAIFKDYYENYKFKNATLENFLDIVKENCGSDIGNYVRAAFTSDHYSTDSMLVSNEELSKIKGRN